MSSFNKQLRLEDKARNRTGFSGVAMELHDVALNGSGATAAAVAYQSTDFDAEFGAILGFADNLAATATPTVNFDNLASTFTVAGGPLNGRVLVVLWALPSAVVGA